MIGTSEPQERRGQDATVDSEACRKWQPLAGAETIWHAEGDMEGTPLRSVAVRLRDGRLAVYSPARGLGREAHGQLRRIGLPGLLVAPNHYHTLGLREWAAAYPEAAVVSSVRASARVQRQCRRPVGDEAALRSALPPEVSVLVPPGTRTGELWLSAPTPRGRAWIVGDGFFNIARTPRGVMGLLLVALGSSPGLRIGSGFRWLLRDRAAYRAWLLERLAREPPTVLVPCHGEVLCDPLLPARLKQLAEIRL
jgi:hypothetical protein